MIFSLSQRPSMLNSFVLRLNMFLEMTFYRRLFITLFTRILDTMLRLNMPLKTLLCCNFLISQITRKLDTFMFRLIMPLQTTHSCSLIIKLITRILDTFMNRLKMCFKITLCIDFFHNDHNDTWDRFIIFFRSPVLLDNDIDHKET